MRGGCEMLSEAYSFVVRAQIEMALGRLLFHSGINWWGSGIVHAKVWISDNRDVYNGSANNDYKSLTQVEEVRIYVTGFPGIAERVEPYF
ncbi:hypothetical protein K1719_010705 [Acacia pycnantha]|nr:hypothetical protein K1719_010705 [Acacia pycnantha]